MTDSASRPTSTGICPYFDPDDGFELSVGPVSFTDGTVINPFIMTG